MREYIGAVFLLNKAETLGVVEPFYGSCNCSAVLLDVLLLLMKNRMSYKIEHRNEKHK